MSDAITCILVADENKAAIYDCRQGVSRLNHEILHPWAPNVADSKARRAFAFRLLSDFSRDAQNGIYDGLIILGTPGMLGAVRGQLSPETRKLLIAEIPCASPTAAAIVGCDSSHLAA